MKKTFFCLWSALLLTAGCNNTHNVNGKNAFPEFLVGVWEAPFTPSSKWGVKFEKDGSIKKIIHHWAGPINLDEGGKQEPGQEEGTYFVIVMGPCDAEYDAETRTLKMKIITEHWTMKFPQETLTGNQKDYFVGTVSDDGKTWNAQWRSYAQLEGSDPIDPKLVEENPVPLVFKKLNLEELTAAPEAKTPSPPTPTTP